MIFSKKIRLGDLLVQDGLVTEEQVNIALAKKEPNEKLGEALIREGFVSEESIGKALSKQLETEFVELESMHINQSILKMFQASILKKHSVFPIDYTENNFLKLAMSDPLDTNAQDDIRIIINMQIEPVIATKKDIMLAIAKYYGQNEAQDAIAKYAQEKNLTSNTEFNSEDEKALDMSPIVSLVKEMIENAVRMDASDIHVEPLDDEIRIRYRVDGSLVESGTYDIGALPAIMTRIKILGGMDIAEKRKPQDGRITQIVDNIEYDIRVSVIPTVYGEKTVMRLTQKTALSREISQLGLRKDDLNKFRYILSHPHGIMLVTGPTGSGKSTTLYTALSELNQKDVNIITVEDPVEANIRGINQIQTNPKAGLTFATALRSILRQDPDIIMVGEIRDQETAQIAVQASITGHLVVSTLHTNSSASTITRLEDMGIEPYLIADSVVGVIAQRLVRKLCPQCKKEVFASEEQKKMLGRNTAEQLKIYEPCGCDKCNGTGYKGRIGVYEILPMTPELQKIISKNGDADEIKKKAVEQGMKTLHESASDYVIEGITSYSEMIKVSFDS